MYQCLRPRLPGHVRPFKTIPPGPCSEGEEKISTTASSRPEMASNPTPNHFSTLPFSAAECVRRYASDGCVCSHVNNQMPT